MRIMGLDLSITCTGVSLPDGATRVIKPKSSGDERLSEIASVVRNLVAGDGVQLVVIEDVPSTMKGAAGKIVPMLHGPVRVDLMRLATPYMVLSPSSLKKFATGKGTADKTGMALAALKRLGREYGTSDECDADWLRIAGRFAYGRGELVPTAQGRLLTLPQDQIAALRWAGTGKARHELIWPVVGGRQPWPGVALRT